jgi:phosphatidylinositol alpha-1,6-mannosyltransferase
VPSLLATNDFPPKLGGIQSYLYELWRRLPPEATTVLTTPYEGADEWDARQPFRVVRTRQGFLLPTARMRRQVDAIAREVGADVVFLDPMLPLGSIGPGLDAAPYVVVAHGAEISVYGRIPGSRARARRVLRQAAGVVAAGDFAAEAVRRVAGRDVPTLRIPPGVDPARFHPLTERERREVRTRHGLPVDAPIVLGVSRLVPRKGFDVLLDAAAPLDDVHVVIAGAGRDEARLRSRARRLGARAHLLGRVPDDELPGLYGAADVFAMVCRERWGGLEAEGYGIVFLEAAAVGVASIAGRSGGAHEAVVDGVTGLVVEPRDVAAVRAALERVLGDDELRRRMGSAGRARVEGELAYDALAARLAPLADGDLSVFG